MGNHDPKKMYYWHLQNLQNQEPNLETKRICQKCGRVVPPSEIMITNICRKCYDAMMKRISENMNKHIRE